MLLYLHCHLVVRRRIQKSNILVPHRHQIIHRLYYLWRYQRMNWYIVLLLLELHLHRFFATCKTIHFVFSLPSHIGIFISGIFPWLLFFLSGITLLLIQRTLIQELRYIILFWIRIVAARFFLELFFVNFVVGSGFWRWIGFILGKLSFLLVYFSNLFLFLAFLVLFLHTRSFMPSFIFPPLILLLT